MIFLGVPVVLLVVIAAALAVVRLLFMKWFAGLTRVHFMPNLPVATELVHLLGVCLLYVCLTTHLHVYLSVCPR